VITFDRSNAGTMALLGLLVTAMVLTAGLTLEALRAERAHRAAVQRALRDDASVLGDDLIHRTIFEFEMFASTPLRRVIARHLLDYNVLPSIEGLASDVQVADVAFVIDRLFIVDTDHGTVTPPQPEPLQSWALQKLPGMVRKRYLAGDSTTLRVRLSDGDHLLVYGTAQLAEGRIFAFTVHEQALGNMAARAFSHGSVFPGVLGGGHLTNNDVFIRMARGNLEIFHTAGTFDETAGVTMAPHDDYSESVRGLTVQCSFTPRAVSALVPGGLPRSRLPLLIVILLTSSMVLAAAFVVLRRERQLTHIRSDFVSGVSHELRTPLTQIRMFSETLLLDRVRSAEERQRSLLIIHEEAQRLTNLVDNVLFLSRGPRTDRPPLIDDCDMEALVADAVDAFAPLAMRRDVVITADTPPRLHARVDCDAWKQVLTNMLDNAVKYGPPGQTVHVRLSREKAMIRLEVEDEGPGVPADERESIWQRFHRLDRDRGTHKAGSGIGLAIVREIIASHAGRCWVENADGGGARFVVEAPIDGPEASV
jgi:signal transduction histidine kinase